MRLSTTERDCLFQLLTNHPGDVAAGDCGKVANLRTKRSLFDKGLLTVGAHTGNPHIDYTAPEWDCVATRRVIKEAQDYLDEIDSQGDPSLLEEPRLIDAFNF